MGIFCSPCCCVCGKSPMKRLDNKEWLQDFCPNTNQKNTHNIFGDYKSIMESINLTDKLITLLGKYGYLIVGTISMIISGYFALMATLQVILFHITNSFYYLILGYIFLFIVGYCWNKDTERIMNEKNKNE